MDQTFIFIFMQLLIVYNTIIIIKFIMYDRIDFTI